MKDVDYVIFDEGLTQSAISLTQNGVGDVRKIEATLYHLCDNPQAKKIYIKVNLDLAFARMASRKTNDSRIEKLQNDNEKMQALKLFELSCKKIAPTFVNDEANAKCAASAILKQITKSISV